MGLIAYGGPFVVVFEDILFMYLFVFGCCQALVAVLGIFLEVHGLLST